jgi:hypothetical protein
MIPAVNGSCHIPTLRSNFHATMHLLEVATCTMLPSRLIAFRSVALHVLTASLPACLFHVSKRQQDAGRQVLDSG